jgi:RNA polymerase sigma-70 factor, ECF subfamily
MNVVGDEAQLIVEACQGSKDAFEALVMYYEPRIRRLLYSLTKDAHLTQDLCQETFLAAYRVLPRMDGQTLHFAPWLYRIALNQLRSEWRRRKHVSVVPFSLPGGDEDDFLEEPVESGLISEGGFEERIVERELVRRVLAQLPRASAICLLLDAEGFTYNEIAETLQDSFSAVRSRIFRARQMFQRIYTGLDQEGR